MEDADGSLTDNRSLDRILKQTYKAVQLGKIEDVTFLLGSTGSGKSSLLKFLHRDVSLQSKKNTSGDLFIFADDSTIASENSSFAITTQPNVVFDTSSRSCMIDCVGFEDISLLVSAFTSKLVFDVAKRFKVVILEEFSCLNGNENPTKLKKTIQHLAQLLKDNCVVMSGSIGLVVTKVDSNVDEGTIISLVKSSLQRLLEGFINEGLNAEKTIIEGLLQGDKVGVFRRPDVEGSPWNSQLLLKNRRNLQTLMANKLIFCSSVEKFYYKVDATTLNFIYQTAMPASMSAVKESFNSINSSVLEYFQRQIDPHSKSLETKITQNIEICLQFIRTLRTIQSLQQVISFLNNNVVMEADFMKEFQFQASKLQFFYQIANKNTHEIDALSSNFFGGKDRLVTNVHSALSFQRLLADLIAEFANFQVRLFNDQIRNTFQSLNVDNCREKLFSLGSLGFSPEICVSLAERTFGVDQLQAMKNLALVKTQAPVECRKSKNSVTYLGRFIILSQISESIASQAKPLQDVILLAAEKLYIDCDLTLEDTHLAIVASTMEIVGKPRNIYLCGSHGVPPTQRKARGAATNEESGSHGADGNAGWCAGFTRIYTSDVINAQLLTIHAIGGNGSDGQDGGDGKNAENAPVPEFPSRRTSWDHVGELIVDVESQGYSAKVSEYRTTINNDHLLYNITASIIPFMSFAPSVDFSLTVTKMGDKPPTNGGNGGKAGPGAKAGVKKFLVKSGVELAFSIKNGVSGQPGRGGIAGRNSSNGAFQTFSCHSDEKELNGLEHKSKVTGELTSKYAEASNGENGSLPPMETAYRYKINTMCVLHEILGNFCKFIVNDNTTLENDHPTVTFLNFLFVSNAFVEAVPLKDFLLLLEVIESLCTGEIISKKSGNLRLVYVALHMALKQMQLKGKNIDPAIAIAGEISIVSRLSMVDSIFTRKQIVSLKSVVSTALDKVSSVGDHVELLRRMNVSSSEKNSLLEDIKKATKLIESKNTEKIKEVKERVDASMADLIASTQSLKAENADNIEQLKMHHKKMSEVIKIKLGFGILNSVTQLAGIMWAPVAVIGSVVANKGAELLASQPTIDIQQYQAKIRQGVENIKKLIAQIEADKANKLKQYNSILDSMFEAEAKLGKFLNTEDKLMLNKKLKSLASEEAPEKFTFIYDSASKIDKVEEVLKQKIEQMQQEGYSTEAIGHLKRIQENLPNLKFVAGAAEAAVRTMNEYEKDKLIIKHLNEAVKVNEEAIADLAMFEKQLHDYFKPMLVEMLGIFEKIKEGSIDQSTFILEFQKFDLKVYARKFISLISKCTEGFDSEQELIRSIFFELQDFMATVINVFDKINDIKYRVQLVDFIGQMNNKVHNDETKQTLLKTQSKIWLNDLIRELTLISGAYQQVLFPYGGDKMEVLCSVLTQLSQNLTPQQSEMILKSTLVSIKSDLLESSDKINNHTDAHLTTCKFDSEHVSTRPFYVWRGSDFKENIKKLLLGEPVTFVASVATPGARSAVKFRTIALNFKGCNVACSVKLHSLLQQFEVEMVHSGENHYKCGSSFYTIGGETLQFNYSYERDGATGDSVSKNAVIAKLKSGEVSLSPYTVWKFQLIHCPNDDLQELKEELALLADQVDLELVGEGSYIKDGASICSQDLGHFYTYYEP